MLTLLLSLGTLLPPDEVPATHHEPHLHRPDVQVVLLDDVSKSDFDEISLPVMHRLAGEGRTFERAYAMPNCSPSRFAL